MFSLHISFLGANGDCTSISLMCAFYHHLFSLIENWCNQSLNNCMNISNVFFSFYFFFFFFQFSSFGSLLLHVTNVFILSSCYIYFINFKIVYSLELHTKFRSNHRGNIFSVFFFRDYMISSKINQTKEKKKKNSITRVFRSTNYIVWRNYALFLHPLRRQFLYHLKCFPFKNQFTENKRKKNDFVWVGFCLQFVSIFILGSKIVLI